MSCSDEEKELVIAGAGPAGVSAALMALSLGLQPLLVDLHGVGGRLDWIGQLRNVPGFRSGTEMKHALEQQIVEEGVDLLRSNVSAVERVTPGTQVTFEESGTRVRAVRTQFLIWAAGLSPRGVADHPLVEQHGDVPTTLLTLSSYDDIARASHPLVIGGDRPLVSPNMIKFTHRTRVCAAQEAGR